ncbi:MAG: methyltransferase domain-containing protein [Cyclobacteriaceae bacterium]
MQGYEEIFIKRGRSYHSAMAKSPDARVEEFNLMVEFISPQKDGRILDLPAGGGYLKRYLPPNLSYLAYDFSGEFDDNHTGVRKCKEATIDLSSESVDVVASLAALHHIVDRDSFYGEMHRTLKSNGQFILGDVVEGSKPDYFLNVFVNRWNSMGHTGRFMDAEVDSHELEGAGFSVEFRRKSFYWNFQNKTEAMDFFRNLFYLDKNPSKKELFEALSQLGCVQENNRFRVKWSLGFLLAKKG